MSENFKDVWGHLMSESVEWFDKNCNGCSGEYWLGYVKCNNCGKGCRDDENPDFSGQEYASYELTLQEDEGGWFYGCPSCKTDGYLSNITENKFRKLIEEEEKAKQDYYSKYPLGDYDALQR
tara:strand:+ start:152 stop:517 length:366 start_codon:yes stop_codon:yes gene_type:complete